MNELRFVVDVNVGRLAKWLRVMGYDTLFPEEADDNDLVRVALKEDRLIITRDTGIAKRRLATTGRMKVVLILHDDLASQLRQLIRALDLDGSREFSRCIRCNEPLATLAKELAKGQVPPHVYDTQQRFMECPQCHRIYWRGTHWANMNQELAQLRGGK